MYDLPLFLYRQRQSCFSLDIRLKVWNILNKEPYLSKISVIDFNEIRKRLSESLQDDKEIKLTKIEKMVRSSF